MQEDKRYTAVRERFESCSDEELQRIIDDQDKLCLDTFNYDLSEKTFCPIALAMNLHNEIKSPTDDLIKEEIGKRFTPTNILKGVDGSFYTSNRKKDILTLCKEILNKRKQQ